MITLAERQMKLIAEIVAMMAFSGEGTDECLDHNALPVPVTFHSPIPDLKDLDERNVWDRRGRMAGIEMDMEKQVSFVQDLAARFKDECRWPDEAPEDPYLFYSHNPAFSYWCAASTHYMLRHFKPRRVIEVGSGSSSLAIAGALRLNHRETGAPAEYVVIDPFPREKTLGIPGLSRLMKQMVQVINMDVFLQLQENDVLFVDSSHVVRIGGDVNFLMLEVLPILQPGVLIHFHDIPMPLEYNKIYFTNPKWRVFWTESYLLQAFLCFNKEFDILLAMSALSTYLQEKDVDAFMKAFPHHPLNRPGSQSFWIRRRSGDPGMAQEHT